MASSISSSINISSLTPSLAFKPKSKFLSRRSILRNPLPTQKYTLPFSTSVRLFPQFQIGCILKPKLRTHVASSASGTEVAVEEAADSETSVAPTDAPEISVESSETSAAKSKRTRPSRKSEMPPVKDEDLKPGSTFTGKVRSIQPFGAFIDFGAFTDGLVHVSQLSDSFVKDVASVVSVGQEVTVRLVEANLDTGRISLTMRSGENSNAQQQRDSPAGNDKSRPPRKAGQRDQKSTKFVKGQDLQGTVKNLTRSGAFITLPEGEEGFLPSSEENDDGFVNMMGGSTLEIGQEVNVRVLRIARGKVTLTMKKDEDDVNLDAKLTGKIHTATNPFVLAFRSSDVISSFLDEREKENDPVEEVVKGTDDISSEVSDKGGLENSETDSKEVEESSPVEDQIAEEPSITDAIENNDQASIVEESSSIEDQTAEEPSITDAIENNDQASIVEESSSIEDKTAEEPSITEAIENKDQAAVVEDVEETAVPLATESDFKSSEDSLPIDATEKELSGELIDENLANTDEEVKSEIADNIIAEDEVQGETINSTSVEEETAALNLEKDESTESPVKEDEVEIPTSADPSQNGNVSSDASPQETVVKAAISPALVKQLRDETGAGMMDCKKALAETEGDIVKAQEFLRKKGLASADKKASRATAEGRVDSYIHDSRIGVLIEVNCETDFVARGDIFKELVQDLAMQVAACPQVQYLSTEDVPTEFVEKEKEMESQKEDLLKKPEQIRSKIVDGRIRKRLEELALLEQPFIRDDKVVVKDWVKQTISTIGENIKVKRFVRYNLGEGLEKKSQDFAAEVAAQTASKPASTAVNPEPAAASENKETTEEPPKVAVSAALVKQLRDETGAGMMDCKKALAETGGDLTKAQEYLRKKGLSTADKKSSRLAAEGRIGSYIHDSRIGVLIEVNCETDFVGRSEKFKELVDDLAMQVVASPQVQYVSIEDIPESIRNKEKEMEMQREDVQSKPENIREKMVEGRVTKRLSELALLEQSYIKADGMLVKDLVKQTVAALGENMKVRRFVRFTLGETRGVEVEN